MKTITLEDGLASYDCEMCGHSDLDMTLAQAHLRECLTKNLKPLNIERSAINAYPSVQLSNRHVFLMRQKWKSFSRCMKISYQKTRTLRY